MDPREVSAAAGYFKAQSVEALQALGVDDVFIPPEKIRHGEWRQRQPPRGRPPRHLDAKGGMRRGLRTKYGRSRYRLREEAVFGQIKWSRGLRQLLLRGLAKVRTSWRFECAIHNILKLSTPGAVLA